MALNDVPLANQRIKDTQAPIRTNFSDIDTQFAVNHESFNSVDQGKHKFVTFTNQAGAPIAGAGEIIMNNRVDPVTTQQELYLTTLGVDFPITSRNTSSSAGYSYLPSGIILQWGSATINGTGNMNFAITFPTACLQVFLQNLTVLGDDNSASYVQNFTAANVTVVATNRTTFGPRNNVRIAYLAIGY